MNLLEDENPIPASRRPEPDLYETNPVLVRALMGHVSLPRDIWEPAAGRGAISKVLQAGGHRVLSTDKFNHGSDYPVMTGMDFLDIKPITHPSCIVTNPPFNKAEAFVRRALDVADVSYMLMRVQFICRVSSRDIMAKMAGFYPLSPRPERMHLDQWQGPKAGGRGDYAWYCYSRHHVGLTDCRPLYWRDYEMDGQMSLEAAE